MRLTEYAQRVWLKESGELLAEDILNESDMGQAHRLLQKHGFKLVSHQTKPTSTTVGPYVGDSSPSYSYHTQAPGGVPGGNLSIASDPHNQFQGLRYEHPDGRSVFLSRKVGFSKYVGTRPEVGGAYVHISPWDGRRGSVPSFADFGSQQGTTNTLSLDDHGMKVLGLWAAAEKKPPMTKSWPEGTTYKGDPGKWGKVVESPATKPSGFVLTEQFMEAIQPPKEVLSENSAILYHYYYNGIGTPQGTGVGTAAVHGRSEFEDGGSMNAGAIKQEQDSMEVWRRTWLGESGGPTPLQRFQLGQIVETTKPVTLATGVIPAFRKAKITEIAEDGAHTVTFGEGDTAKSYRLPYMTVSEHFAPENVDHLKGTLTKMFVESFEQPHAGLPQGPRIGDRLVDADGNQFSIGRMDEIGRLAECTDHRGGKHILEIQQFDLLDPTTPLPRLTEGQATEPLPPGARVQIGQIDATNRHQRTFCPQQADANGLVGKDAHISFAFYPVNENGQVSRLYRIMTSQAGPIDVYDNEISSPYTGE